MDGRNISHGIENLFAVEQEQCIFRGGDPTAEGWAWLWGEGVRVAIKLNTNAEGSDVIASHMGIQVFPFPIGWFRQVIWHPSDRFLHEVVSYIGPHTYIHCEHGEDRTGLIVGCFRLKQGWSKEDAWEEMIAHKFHLALGGLVRAWDRQKAEEWLR